MSDQIPAALQQAFYDAAHECCEVKQSEHPEDDYGEVIEKYVLPAIAALTAENARLRGHMSTALAALEMAQDESSKAPWVVVPMRELRRAMG